MSCVLFCLAAFVEHYISMICPHACVLLYSFVFIAVQWHFVIELTTCNVSSNGHLVYFQFLAIMMLQVPCTLLLVPTCLSFFRVQIQEQKLPVIGCIYLQLYQIIANCFSKQVSQFTSDQLCRMPIALYLCQHMVVLDFQIFINTNGVKQYFTMVLIWISLLAVRVNTFMCLLASWISSLVRKFCSLFQWIACLYFIAL